MRIPVMPAATKRGGGEDLQCFQHWGASIMADIEGGIIACQILAAKHQRYAA